MDSLALIAPEDSVYAIAARLLAVQHAVAEMAGGRKLDFDPKALRQAVLQIRAILKSIEGAHGVFIGGLAVQHHGYERWTDDVDMVVDRAHFREIVERIRGNGFELLADFSFLNKQTGAKLDLLQEGAVLKHATLPLPHPSLLGASGGFATIPSLVLLKLQTLRMKDKADIVEMIKCNMGQASGLASQLPLEFRDECQKLVAQARLELQ